jgi:hypothetical protein
MKAVFVDGVNKGEVFKRKGRLWWRRGPVAVEPFARGSTLEDVCDWARKCCNGTQAEIKTIDEEPEPPRLGP